MPQDPLGLRHCDVQTNAVKQEELRDRDPRLARAVPPGLRSIAGDKIRPYEDPDGVVRYFTFLRDPVKRCIGRHQFQIRHMNPNRSFEAWFRRAYYRGPVYQRALRLARLFAG